MLISSPLHSKKGKWGAEPPPHPPRGGQSPPPAPPPTSQTQPPAAILGAAGRGLKMAGPQSFYTFTFQLKPATSQQRGGDFKTI